MRSTQSPVPVPSSVPSSVPSPVSSPSPVLSPSPECEAAREAALRLLARRALSVNELTAKLEALGYGVEVCDDAVAWLLDLGYLNDEALARDRAEALSEKGYGFYRIQFDLRRRGLDPSLADQVLAELPDAAEAIDDHIARMMAGRDAGDPQQRRRTAAALSRRGFPSDDINAGMARFMMHDA
ncbi:MAG: RecX family transcriptional regulator [Oscillospiraceae bacterium]|nr:RecX family transcriptional regulator [Oscillospiraceae bacterium]